MNILELKRLADHEILSEARLLLLLSALAGRDDEGWFRGLSRLALLDFLLRYPKHLQSVLDHRNLSTRGVNLEDYEIENVEQTMSMNIFGPWDGRYKQHLNRLVARGLIEYRSSGAHQFRLTPLGDEVSRQLHELPSMENMVSRCNVLATRLDKSRDVLNTNIYAAIPELAGVPRGMEIDV